LELAKTYFAEKKFDKAKATIADLQRASPKDLISEIEALLAQITHEEEILAEEKAQKGYAYAELAKATDFPLPEGATATDFDAQEEERILKYIMFEGKL
jgi:vacuolar-type H+-ATPase subunit I/STV1